jgi:hypothetical protein
MDSTSSITSFPASAIAAMASAYCLTPECTRVQQMDRFQPMLELGERFADEGATFERPIMNYAILWQLGSQP